MSGQIHVQVEVAPTQVFNLQRPRKSERFLPTTPSVMVVVCATDYRVMPRWRASVLRTPSAR